MEAALHSFAEIVGVPEDKLDLGRAALAVAQVEVPDLAPTPSLERIARLARRSGAAREGDPAARLGRLVAFLFGKEGFQGNRADYYDPRNSCLNEVLERRLGIPITLSVLMIEIGLRVGLDLHGVGLPGHFVVGADLDGEHVLVDPFHGGSMLSRESAAAVVEGAVGRPVQLSEEHFAPCVPSRIVTRMLLNLRSIYVSREAWPKALSVIERLLIVDGGEPSHLRDRGSVLVKLRQYHRGVRDWEVYLSRCPEAKDCEQVRRQVRRVREGLAVLN